MLISEHCHALTHVALASNQLPVLWAQFLRSASSDHHFPEVLQNAVFGARIQAPSAQIRDLSTSWVFLGEEG